MTRWIPPWLGRIYSTLWLEFQYSAFTVDEARVKTDLAGPEARLALSRLCALGWAIRLSRGQYLATTPEYAMLSLERDWDKRLRDQSTFPVLQLATGMLVRFYERRLVSLAVFGSAARGTPGKSSDVDVLVVADGLGDSYPARVEELDPVQTACSGVRRSQWLASGDYHPLDLVILKREELRENSLFLLDLTRDAVVMFDRGGVLGGSLADLSHRLETAGSRRIETRPGRWYWDLRPGAKLGEKIVL